MMGGWPGRGGGLVRTVLQGAHLDGGGGGALTPGGLGRHAYVVHRVRGEVVQPVLVVGWRDGDVHVLAVM